MVLMDGAAAAAEGTDAVDAVVEGTAAAGADAITGVGVDDGLPIVGCWGGVDAAATVGGAAAAVGGAAAAVGGAATAVAVDAWLADGAGDGTPGGLLG